MVQQALDHANRGVQPAVRNALDRIAPMLRFFRAGDGGCSSSTAAARVTTRTVEAALDHDEALASRWVQRPIAVTSAWPRAAPLFCSDAGAPPLGPRFDDRALPDALPSKWPRAFTAIIVNCGMAPGDNEAWTLALRSTAAHSTLMLDEVSSASVLHTPSLVRLLGPARQPRRISWKRAAARARRAHRRCKPRRLSAPLRRDPSAPPDFEPARDDADGLGPADSRQRQWAARQAARTPRALHDPLPCAPRRAPSLAQNGGSVILKLPNGEGWRFRCSGGALAIEESIYFGGGSARRGGAARHQRRMAGRSDRMRLALRADGPDLTGWPSRVPKRRERAESRFKQHSYYAIPMNALLDWLSRASGGSGSKGASFPRTCNLCGYQGASNRRASAPHRCALPALRLGGALSSARVMA
jgi:hypothetical protein